MGSGVSRPKLPHLPRPRSRKVADAPKKVSYKPQAPPLEDLTALPSAAKAMAMAAQYLAYHLETVSLKEEEKKRIAAVHELLLHDSLVDLLNDAESSVPTAVVARKMTMRVETEAGHDVKSYILNQFSSNTSASRSIAHQRWRIAKSLVVKAKMGSDFRPSLAQQLASSQFQLPYKRLAAEHISKSYITRELLDAEAEVVVKVKSGIEKCEWKTDVTHVWEIINAPMTFVVESILRKYEATTVLGVSEQKIFSMLRALEAAYPMTNPYHNAMHAADVAFTAHCILELAKEKLNISPLQAIVAVLAAAGHDVRHPGVNNAYLAATYDILAIRYNDRAICESMHASEFFALLNNSKQDVNIFSGLSKDQFKEARKSIIGMILATDMQQHFELLAKFKQNHADVPEGGAVTDVQTQDFLMSVIVHAADISNPAKPLPTYLDWTDRVLAEFYSQGEKERSHGLDISPMFDQMNPAVKKSQAGFIGFIVKPLFTAVCDWLPVLRPLAFKEIEANAAEWVDGSERSLAQEGRPFALPEHVAWDSTTSTWIERDLDESSKPHHSGNPRPSTRNSVSFDSDAKPIHSRIAVQ